MWWPGRRQGVIEEIKWGIGGGWETITVFLSGKKNKGEIEAGKKCKK